MNRGDYKLIQEPYSTLEENSGDLIAYFIPDTTLASWRGWPLSGRFSKWARDVYTSMSGNRLEKSVYPGWISLIAIVLSICLRSFRKRAWPWLVLSLSFWVISLGPTLFINGKPYLKGLLPCRFLNLIPIFDIIRSPTRFSFFVTLGAGILVSIGIAKLRSSYSLRTYKAITFLILIMIIAEFLPSNTLLTPNNIFKSGFYYQIQKDPINSSVLNIPTDFTGETGGGDIYVYAQTIHHKPIIGGYVSREPAYALKTLYMSPFLKAVTRNDSDENSGLPLTEAGLKKIPETLERLNVGYIILHKPLLELNEFRRVSKWVERGLGRPVFEDEWIHAYQR
ncbi:hypothetical protein ACFL0H_09395 [Thermodesulfobacteriota bacterium]